MEIVSSPSFSLCLFFFCILLKILSCPGVVPGYLDFEYGICRVYFSRFIVYFHVFFSLCKLFLQQFLETLFLILCTKSIEKIRALIKKLICFIFDCIF